MTPLLWFNSSVLVLWTTFLIPHALKNENRVLLWASSVFMLVAEIYLCLHWAQREFPFNLLAAFAIFLIGLIGGRAAHHFYQYINEEQS